MPRRENINTRSDYRRQNAYQMQMQGSGVLDKMRDAIAAGKSVAGKAAAVAGAAGLVAGLYTGPIGTAARNLIPASDETARSQFPGEKHAILRLKNGYPGTANFMGPGTKIDKRLRRGDPPRTLADKVSMAHDIRYGLSRGNKDLLRKSDKRMVASLKRIRKAGTDSRLNTIPAMKAIESKMALEDRGIASRDTFTTFDNPHDRGLLIDKLTDLHQEGFGLLPGDRLKLEALKMIKKASRTALVRGTQVSVNKVSSFIAGKLLPKLMTQIKRTLGQSGRGITKNIAAKVRASINKGGKTVTAISKRASQVILPLLFKAYKSKKKNVKALLPKLHKAILSKVSQFVSGKMSGSGFFSDFGKGFVQGFTKTVKVGLPIATLLI